ncbi:arginine--tRNA ligase [Schleiferilactobacillus harbinensis]|uniref:Arginine--tRNA ligase n=1 Tax=Schleiferilactobacillus harbinensis TaxID=304207 RepID=A0A5P8M4C7_9LACO|nr:arginine--tRNA ligase [Schleiferilactobacillus harbinensis]MBO3090511.1 arginine--tRNA ligase [Schleiferilactobacillus harbinensis]QFR23167.1 arginine--tRNA ligase [Schleiferilactobacillus harbinensis]
MDLRHTVAEKISQALNQIDASLTTDQVADLLEVPKSLDLGDFAFPAFQLAKTLHKSPVQIAQQLAPLVNADGLQKVEAKGPYVNVFLDQPVFAHTTFHAILSDPASYGAADIGHGGNVPIDMSSPNIAKPMSMGHLRSTVIGNALANIFSKLGYHPIKINHLGDWGTQFGKLIVGYKMWGSEEAVKENPIKNLLAYYVRFHQEDKDHPEMDDEAREWFKKLEEGDPEATKLWAWFREISLKEFQKVYDQLGVTFDSYNGEAFYNDKMDEVIQILEQKGLLEKSQGADIVDLSDQDLNPALIRKSDGASLYMTRDLAAAIYRKRTYNFVKSLYVVGGEQKEHFDQLKAVLKKMGFDWADEIVHVPFGLITENGKKLSTRSGRIILLEKVLQDAVGLAQKQVDEKNPTLANKEEVAHQVGVGAVVFHDLKNDRMDNFDFNLEEVVRFEGETGPYVQYTNARAQSILRKAGKTEADLIDAAALDDAGAWEVIRTLGDFPEIITRAAREYEPSVIAKYALRLAKAFNKYYAHTKVLTGDAAQDSRLALVASVSAVLQSALALLGVGAPAEM